MGIYIYGKNTVKEVLQSKRKVYNLYVTDIVYNKEKDIIKMANKKNIRTQILNKRELEKMVSGNHQGIVMEVEDYKYSSIDDILETANKRNENPFIIILDGIQDSHNLGAILRTADATSVHGIIIPKNRSVKLNSTVAKLSTGAIEYIKVAQVTNLTRTIKELKDKGAWIVGTDASESDDYRKVDYSIPVAIVIGSEGKGISRLVLQECDFKVHLPMNGKVTSLNASVATAIIMYEVFNQRNPL